MYKLSVTLISYLREEVQPVQGRNEDTSYNVSHEVDSNEVVYYSLFKDTFSRDVFVMTKHREITRHKVVNPDFYYTKQHQI